MLRAGWIRLRRHPTGVLIVSIAIAAAVAFALTVHAGLGAVADRFSELHAGWLLVALGAEVLALGGYALAYRSLVKLEGGPALSAGLLSRLVLAGFGAFAPDGGLASTTRLCARSPTTSAPRPSGSSAWGRSSTRSSRQPPARPPWCCCSAVAASSAASCGLGP
jgi:hypothetical protein